MSSFLDGRRKGGENDNVMILADGREYKGSTDIVSDFDSKSKFLAVSMRSNRPHIRYVAYLNQNSYFVRLDAR